MAEKLLWSKEAAAQLRIDVKTLANWAKRGYIPFIPLPSGHRRYRQEDVDAILRASTDAPRIVVWDYRQGPGGAVTTPLFDMLADERTPGPLEWRPVLMYVFDVHGNPAPQGSKRHVGRGVMVESSKHVKPWRAAVTAAAVDEFQRLGRISLIDGPIVAEMIFSFVRPRSHFRSGKNSALLREGMPPQPPVMPDLSKLARSTEDAISKVLWTDDARIVEYRRLAKVYVNEDVDALASPGARIRVFALDPR